MGERNQRIAERRQAFEGLVAMAASGEGVSSFIDIFASRVAVDECTLCPLSDTAAPVPWAGQRSSIMLVGEAPGAEEDRIGVPFVGRSGEFLSQQLAIAGVDRSTIAVTNTIACRPPRNDYEFAESVHAPILCRAHLNAALAASHAWIVVSVGGKAAAEFGWSGGVGRNVGRWMWKGGRLHTAIWHPAYLLRQGGMSSKEAKRNIDTLRTAREIAEGLPRNTPAAPYDPSMMSSIGAPPRSDDALSMGELIRRNGWVPIRSAVLDRNVIVYDDARLVAGEFNIPPGMGDVVYFTLDELARLKTHDEVRHIAAFKDVLPGARVVA